MRKAPPQGFLASGRGGGAAAAGGRGPAVDSLILRPTRLDGIIFLLSLSLSFTTLPPSPISLAGATDKQDKAGVWTHEKKAAGGACLPLLARF